ncbi:MAG TPA: SDR family NAD(P)-dependent oxidoreductase [Solirubrobacteraceae bacterium]|jgi:NAD(P)-dependent dehydrogenase (short-subunit alcohol dehydrogenase family)|nr:SDR family NAD(P)-dependent oxidoreductase [Solirubrobacteraceae bacterium]
MNFEGKTVLVTGSTSGIGRAAAEQFGRGGATVIVTGRDATRGAEVVAAIEAGPGSARFIAADLAEADGARQLAAAVGNVDVLVNNAGIFPFGATHEIPIEQVRAVFDFNVVAPFTLVAAFAPGMAQRGKGAIVNVSTMVASFGNPGMSAYGASKAALELLTKAWAAEYGPAGVRVNTVAPGPTRTPGVAEAGDLIDRLASTLPLRRPASAEEIANAIVYLASDDASFITGAIVPADGGRVAV